MKRLLYFLALCFCSNAQAQIANGDFENWYTDSTGKARLPGWEHLVKYDFPNNNFFGTWKDSASQHGQYALTISRWYSYTWDVIRQGSAINFRTAALSGYYKYTDNMLYGGTLDTGLLELYLTKWNTAFSRRDTIGTGLLALTFSTNYSHFVCPVDYTSFVTPDSIRIHFQPTKFNGGGGGCASGGWCSYLTIDNLSLEKTTSVQPLSNGLVELSPNPVSTILSCDFSGTGIYSVSATDAVGRAVYQNAAASGHIQIDVRGWSNGIYFLHINSKDFTGTIRVIKDD